MSAFSTKPITNMINVQNMQTPNKVDNDRGVKAPKFRGKKEHGNSQTVASIRGAFVGECRNCSQHGHKANQCPEAKKQFQGKCNNCQRRGHKSKDCKEAKRTYKPKQNSVGTKALTEMNAQMQGAIDASKDMAQEVKELKEDILAEKENKDEHESSESDEDVEIKMSDDEVEEFCRQKKEQYRLDSLAVGMDIFINDLYNRKKSKMVFRERIVKEKPHWLWLLGFIVTSLLLVCIFVGISLELVSFSVLFTLSSWGLKICVGHFWKTFLTTLVWKLNPDIPIPVLTWRDVDFVEMAILYIINIFVLLGSAYIFGVTCILTSILAIGLQLLCYHSVVTIAYVPFRTVDFAGFFRGRFQNRILYFKRGVAALLSYLPFIQVEEWWEHSVQVVNYEYDNDLTIDRRTTEVSHVALKTPEWRVEYVVLSRRVIEVTWVVNGWNDTEPIIKCEGSWLKPVPYTGSLGLFFECATHDIFGTDPDRTLFEQRVRQKFRSKVDVNIDKTRAILDALTHGTFELVRLCWGESMFKWTDRPFH